jgi:toxin FitB
MIQLDTNVILEALRRPGNTNVEQWINAQTGTDLFLCAPVLTELRYGVERLPAGRRRKALDQAIRELEAEGFADRILALDNECANAYGKVLVKA